MSKVSKYLRNAVLGCAALAAGAVSANAADSLEDKIDARPSVNIEVSYPLIEKEYAAYEGGNEANLYNEDGKPTSFERKFSSSSYYFGDKLGLTFDESQRSFNYSKKVLDTPDIEDQERLLRNIGGELNTAQKYHMAAIMGDSMNFTYDYLRKNNGKNSGGIVTFDEIADKQHRLQQTSNLLDIALEEIIEGENRDYNGGSHYNKNILNKYLTSLVSEITGVSSNKAKDLVERAVSEVKEDKGVSGWVVSNITKYLQNYILEEDLIGAAGVCRDIAAYQAWQLDNLGVEDAFSLTTSWDSSGHVVAGGRDENGDIVFLNYGNVFFSGESNLGDALPFYEQQVMHGTNLFNYVSRGESKGGDVKRFQTPAGETLESLVRDDGTKQEQRKRIIEEDDSGRNSLSVSASSNEAGIEGNVKGFNSNIRRFHMNDPKNTLKDGRAFGVGYSTSLKPGVISNANLEVVNANLKGGGKQDFLLYHGLIGYSGSMDFRGSDLSGYVFAETIGELSKPGEGSTNPGDIKSNATDSNGLNGIEVGLSTNHGNFSLGGFIRGESFRKDIRDGKTELRLSHHGVFGEYDFGNNKFGLNLERNVGVNDKATVTYEGKLSHGISWRSEIEKSVSRDDIITDGEERGSVGMNYRNNNIDAGISVEDSSEWESPELRTEFRARF